jgi:beta-glucanase (GH16 family)
MKTRMILSMFFAAVAGLMACSDERETVYAPDNQQVTLSVTEEKLTADAASFNVNVTTDHEFAAYSTVDWMTVSPEGSVKKNETLTVTVEANTETESRTGEVIVWCGGTRRAVKVSQAGVEAPDTEITAPDGYSLVWNDEFDGTELSSDWTFEVAGPGFVNNELQNYVKGNDVAEVSNGTLKINLYKDGNDIKSARIYAKRNQGWKYGYIEASIKLPEGKGTWPAFWMMPVNFTSWPGDGEIDIMESVGYDLNVVVSTIHCNKYNNGGTAIESARTSVATAYSEFHKYALEWTADKMVFYVDGKQLLTYNNDGTGKDAWPFDSPFYVILNLAWGGSWGGLQGVDESCLPATMEVDYVRVFQK